MSVPVVIPCDIVACLYLIVIFSQRNEGPASRLNPAQRHNLFVRESTACQEMKVTSGEMEFFYDQFLLNLRSLPQIIISLHSKPLAGSTNARFFKTHR